MRTILNAFLTAALLAATGMHAAAQPKQPSRDHAVTYRMENEGRTAEMRVFYRAATRRQRVEMPEGGIAMIHDLAANRMLMLNERTRMVMEMPVNAPQSQQMPTIPDDMTLTRTGSATVAGHRCTTYRAVQRGVDRGTVCVTDDGIMLQADLRQGDRRGRMEATSLSLAPQPASLFDVPQGWQTMPTPTAPPGGQRPPQR